MDQDKDYTQKLESYKTRTTYVQQYSGLVKQLLQSCHPASWKILQNLILTAQSQKTNHLTELRIFIQRNLRIVRSFPMLVFLYSLKQTRNDFRFYNVYWRSEYEEVGVKMGDVWNFCSWVKANCDANIVQESLWLVVNTFALFIKNQHINFTQLELSSCIQWITYFQTQDPDTNKYTDACQLIKIVKQTRLTSNVDRTQHILFKKLIEIVCQAKNPSSNVYLFLYPMPLMDQEITYFCQIYSDFLSDIGEDGLCTFFNAITRAAICKQSLTLIYKITQILVYQQQFYKLRYLYQNFILPILIRKAKACTRTQDLLFQISSLYILGFLRHCDIGVQGIQCIIKNMRKIDEKILMKWIQICSSIVLQYPNLREQMVRMLKLQLGRDVELIQGNYLDWGQNSEHVWNVTLRNGRKHKRYVKVPSKMLGISNRNNQCYIITTVQGLQKTGYFQQLLDKYRDKIKNLKSKLLDELRILFGQISGQRPAQKIGVNYLKRISPQQFVKSQHQQDVYEYLIKLIDMIQNQLKNIPSMLQQFKQIFQLQQQNTITCKNQNCSQQKSTKTKTYIHTIANTSILSQLTQQPLLDYTCPKCNSKPGTCLMTIKLIPNSKILIVHINRFSTSNGKIKKQLATQTILRKFMGFQLQGIICHKGKKVQRGHYVYYHRIHERRWALFNDNYVEEFQLQRQDEEFQREWKAEMTPYILFYKKKQDSSIIK